MSNASATVRLMTWNIHGALGSDGRRDLARTIALIRRHNPDVVALQEVDSRWQRGAPMSAFDDVASALGGHRAEARLITAPDGDAGHVVVSRWPFRQTRLHDVSVGRRERRAVIETLVDTPIGTLHLVAMHAGLGLFERRQQATVLIRLVAHHAHLVAVGDFNEWGWPTYLHRALARHFPECTDIRTFPARLPLLRLDRIYCRPVGTLVRGWTDPAARGMSDHLPVIADVRVVTT